MIAEELVGLWDTGPYDYGSMESSSLVLRADGTGWSTWQSAAGEISVTRFAWDCPRPAALEMRQRTVISGTWEPGDPLMSVDERTPDDTVLRTTYTIGRDVARGAGVPFTALRLADPVEFSDAYALVRREIRPDDDPAHDDPGPDR